jgi:hypothetical protein
MMGCTKGRFGSRCWFELMQITFCCIFDLGEFLWYMKYDLPKMWALWQCGLESNSLTSHWNSCMTISVLEPTAKGLESFRFTTDWSKCPSCHLVACLLQIQDLSFIQPEGLPSGVELLLFHTRKTPLYPTNHDWRPLLPSNDKLFTTSAAFSVFEIPLNSITSALRVVRKHQWKPSECHSGKGFVAMLPVEDLMWSDIGPDQGRSWTRIQALIAPGSRQPRRNHDRFTPVNP